MKRASVPSILVVAVLVAFAVTAEAQQPKKVPRIGYLSTTGDPKTPGSQVEAFRQGLRDFGYIEAKNVLVEYRYVEGNVDRIPGLVAELVHVLVRADRVIK
jgi:putative ABC transport system substrate-binding protein